MININKNYKKIVVINCDGIGDVMLSTPVLKGLRKTYPDSKITFIVNPAVQSLAQGFDFINEIVPYKKGMNIFKIIKKIWHYDLSVCLDGRHRSAEIPFLAMVKTRVGAANALSLAVDNGEGLFDLKRGMLLNKKIYLDGSEYNTYQAQNLANIVEKGLDRNLNIDYVKLAAPVVDNKAADTVKSLIKWDNSNIYWAVSPFSSGAWKDWPIDRYTALMGRLQKHNPKIKFIIFGSQENTKVKINYPDFIDLRGKTDLVESFAVLEHVRYFIGGCSAMLHMAAAENLHCVALYGPTSARQYAPKKNTVILKAPFGGNIETMIRQIKLNDVYGKCIEIMNK